MVNDKLLPCVEIEPASPAKASVIWLHGLGADGYDFEPIVPELKLPEGLGVRFVFPHAPRRRVTINNGYVMRAWYDIAHGQLDREEDAQGIIESTEQLGALIEREAERGIPYEHIVVAGFSQGGAIVLHGGLQYPQRLAGIMALSTYLPLAERMDADTCAANREIPVFMAHGTADPIVPLPLAERTRDWLIEQGYALTWHTYSMPHSVSPAEISDIATWLGRILRR